MLAACCLASGGAGPQPQPAPVRARSLRAKLALVAALCLPYVVYMLVIDVPMYHRQWQADEAAGVRYLAFGEGLLRMRSCERVSAVWAVSEAEVGWSFDWVWMSGYFGLGPVLCYGACRPCLPAPPPPLTPHTLPSSEQVSSTSRPVSVIPHHPASRNESMGCLFAAD
jgi:hypothetical protein